MNFRRIAWLLFLPLLAAAPAPDAVVHPDGDGISALPRATSLSAAPTLPAAPGLSGLHAELASPPRTEPQPGGQSFTACVRAAAATTRAAALDRRFLAYARAVLLARAIVPTTSGNPPPASAA